MFEKILIPLDGSRFSALAVPYALEIAKRFGSEVLFLQVVSPSPLALTSTLSGESIMTSADATKIVIETASLQDKKNLARAKRYLRKKFIDVTSMGISGSYHAVLGYPAQVIIEFCMNRSVDLVVMTTSGKSGLKRAFLGSVADEIIRQPGIHVLAIRPETGRRKKQK